jgi:hypothetical protein
MRRLMQNKNYLQKIKKIVVFLIVIPFFIFPFKTGLSAAENTAIDSSGKSNIYDYIIVIDESGSMKNNDPANLRVDAAKLFVYLSEILNKGNRVLIAGFGEKTNIYLPITEITGNEEKISKAIDEIKSDQKITDMKGALAEIKNILDGRPEKRKTAVIFLTDGALTINDIPPQSAGENADKTGHEKSGRGENSQNENPGPITSPEEGTGKNLSSSNSGNENITKSQKQYLEEYKKELLDLCYIYKRDNISIYPIAFTKEAEVELLDQMASITYGASWKAETASEIRNIFIEILKHITSRFIKIEDQKDSSPIIGQVELGDYIKEFVVLALKNKMGANLSVKVLSPSGKEPDYDTVINESAFKIVKIIKPQSGKWSYEIKGDAVFIYDIMDSNILEPRDSIYLTNSQIPLKIELGGSTDPQTVIKPKDFKISCKLEDPLGNKKNDIQLLDDGKGFDDKADDGIFSGNLEKVSQQGNYNIEFDILNTLTGAEALKKINFEVIKLPVEPVVLEPKDSVYLFNIKIPVKVMLKQIEEQEYIDYNEYQIFFNIKYPDGRVAEDLLLQNNGVGDDEKSNDNTFSSSINKPTQEGNYSLEFFIQHIPTMTAPANAGQKIDFKVSRTSEIEINIGNNLIVGTPAIINANFADYSKGDFKYELVNPDGKTIEGELKDDGSAESSDVKKDDGIYSAILEDLDQLGEYKIIIESIYTGKSVSGESVSSESSNPQPGESNSTENNNLLKAESKFNKDFKFEGIPEKIKFDSSSKLQELSFKVISSSNSDSEITIDQQKLSNEFLKSAEVEDSNKIIKANSENEIKVRLELKEDLKQEEFKINIPLIIDKNNEKVIELKAELKQKQSLPTYLIFVLIGAGILVVAAIVIFVYFLYIKPKRLGY